MINVVPEASSGSSLVILDPTNERGPQTRPRAARLAQLAGATVGLLDISKPRGDVFLNRLATLLQDKGASVKRFRKPTFTKPAPLDVRREIHASCNAVIEALAD
jgi:hypothetical protein